jgi:hypothetical protein
LLFPTVIASFSYRESSNSAGTLGVATATRRTPAFRVLARTQLDVAPDPRNDGVDERTQRLTDSPLPPRPLRSSPVSVELPPHGDATIYAKLPEKM